MQGGRYILAPQNDQRVAILIRWGAAIVISRVSTSGPTGDASGYPTGDATLAAGLYRERDGLIPTLEFSMANIGAWIDDVVVQEQIAQMPLGSAFATTQLMAQQGTQNPLLNGTLPGLTPCLPEAYKNANDGAWYNPSKGDIGPIPCQQGTTQAPPLIGQPLDPVTEQPGLGQPVAPHARYLDRLTNDLNDLLKKIDNAKKRRCDDAVNEKIGGIVGGEPDGF